MLNLLTNQPDDDHDQADAPDGAHNRANGLKQRYRVV
jgi:hypothetical protein